MPLTFAQINHPQIGSLSFYAGDLGLCGVVFADLTKLKQKMQLTSDPPSLNGFETLSTLLAEMNEYLDGVCQNFTIDIDWHVVIGFQRQVLKVVSEIPYGQVLSYAEIAKKLGKPGAVRAIGSALARNPMPIVIPCHRVIRSDRTISGYLGGEDVKAYFLELEGHIIKNNRVVA